MKYIRVNNQDYNKLFLEAITKREPFVDQTFPPSDSSLFLSSQNPPTFAKNVEWKRAKDIFRRPQLAAGTLDPRNVKQGSIGNCWFVSAVGVLAAHPVLISKIIPNYLDQDWDHRVRSRDTDHHPGIFRFRFYRFGVWVEVVVDDFLPTIDGKLVFARSTVENELWPALLEKAYAKLNGSYEALDIGSSEDAIVDLTGTVPEHIDLVSSENSSFDKDMLFKVMMDSMRHGALLSSSVAVSNESQRHKRTDWGLILGHAYGIHDVIEVKPSELPSQIMDNLRKVASNSESRTMELDPHEFFGDIRLLRLRNPWGHKEWNGPWSEKSEEWITIPDDIRKRLNLIFENDGDFWMSFDDFCANFTTTFICHRFNTSPWQVFQRRWFAASFYSSWSLSPRKSSLLPGSHTAGGCVNHPFTFTNNPQFLFDLKQPCDVMVSLMQRDQRFKKHLGKSPLTIGFSIMRVENNRKYRIHKLYDVVGTVTYINAREVFSRFPLPAGRYVIVPTTFQPGEETEFLLRLFTSFQTKFRPLLDDAPYNVGRLAPCISKKYKSVVRITVVSANLSSLSNSYLQILNSFVVVQSSEQGLLNRILSDRWHQSTSVQKNTLSPVFNESFVFYLQDPHSTTLRLELWHQGLFNIKRLGFGIVDVVTHGQSDRVGKLWELEVPMSSSLVVKIRVQCYDGLIDS